MIPIKRLFLLFAFSAFFQTNSFSQCDSVALAPDSLQWVFCDTIFSSSGLGGQGAINAVEKVNDTLYISGDFRFVGKYTGSFIGVDTSNGQLYNQPTWPKTDGIVYFAIPDGAGGVIIGGDFTKVGDSLRENLARINAAGQVTSLKVSFALGTGAILGRKGIVSCGLIDNGILYVGGSFTLANGLTRNRLAAINLSTGALTTWAPSVFNKAVYAIVTDGTNIYIAGDFTTVNSTSRNYLAAISISTGATVTTWAPSVNSSGVIDAMLLYNNELYVGGYYTGVGMTIKKINVSTAIASSWGPSLDGQVFTMAVSGNRLFIGGSFANISGQTRRRLAAIDTGTAIATSWNPNITNGVVNTIAIHGNQLFAGGSFATVNGVEKKLLARIDTSTGTTNNLSAKANPGSEIHCLLPVANRVLVGGNFATIDGQYRKKIAAINLKSNTLHTFNYSTNGTVFDIKAENNLLYLAGSFDTINGQRRNEIARINLSNNTLDTWAVPDTWWGRINKIELTNSHIYLGGSYTSSIPGFNSGIIRVNKSTGALDSWTTSTPNIGRVNDIAIAGNNIYLAGDLSSSSGNCVLIKSNTITGASTYINSTSSTSNISTSVKVIRDRIYVAGSFNNIASVSRGNIAAFDTSTMSIIPFNPYNGNPDGINDIDIYKNKLIVLGEQIVTGSTSPITRFGLAVSDTVTGNFVGPWKPKMIYASGKIFFSGDTAFVFGHFDNVQNKKIHSLVRYHLNYPSPTLSISTPTLTPCAATSATITATTAGITTYQWIKNGIVVSGVTGNTYTFTPIAGDSVVCIGSSTSSCILGPNTATSNSIVFNTPITNTTATATLSAIPSTAICAGASVTYTCSTNVTGGSYQWKVGTNSVGTNSNTYTYSPSNGDKISCEVTKAANTCFSPSPVISDTITASVTANTTPTASISPSISVSVCAGTSVTYTCTTNVTGGSYQWKVGTTNVGTNSSAYTYTPANADVITCEVTRATGTCYSPPSVISNSITASVTANTTPTASISPSVSGSVCAGTSVTYTCSTNVTGGSYQWKVGTTNVGTNSTTYTYIPVNGDVITCEVTRATGTCYSPTSVTSNAITASVTANTTSTASITASTSTSVCAGTSVTYTCSTNVTGGSYQWKVGTTNVGTNSSTYSYAPSNGDLISCEVTKATGTCFAPSSVTSNSITASVTANTTPAISIAATATTICPGRADTFTATTNISGGTLQWKVNGNNVIGANNTTYILSPANGDIVTCIITTPAGCYSPTTATSNSITITHLVPIVPTASVIVSPSDTVCIGTSVNYTATTNISGANYQWTVNGINVGTNSAAYTHTPANNDKIACIVSVTTGCYSIPNITSNLITMTVNQKITPSISLSGPSKAATGSPVTINATVANAGSTYTIDWSKNGSFYSTTSIPSLTFTKGAGTETISATIKPTGCYNNTTSNTHTLQENVGVINIKSSSGIIVFPNPFQGHFSVKGLNKGDILVMYDAKGSRVVHTWNIVTQKEEHLFTINDIAVGSYILEVTDTKGNKKGSVQIQKR